ncbi:hypothetical protein ACIB24_04030 [Spongisporangium articulatum]|uniref:DUF4124 domain-containing protein n=1 Tax=Spongisporangium articulatum TaxID=3362603 RepID=A0ABW8AIP1_9ACTN
MKLTLASLLLCAAAVGGLWWYEGHRDQCSTQGFGIMSSVQYCQRPDGSVYLVTPSPTPPAPDPSESAEAT